MSEAETLDFECLLSRKERWAKCAIKLKFGAGVCTTSRVEGLHGVLKKTLTSRSGLQSVFHCFRKVETTQIDKFNNEFYLNKSELLILRNDFMTEVKTKYSNYVAEKIASKFVKALNYNQSVEDNRRNRPKKW